MRMNTQTEYGAHTKSPPGSSYEPPGVFIEGSFHGFLVHAVAVVGVAQGQIHGSDKFETEFQRQLNEWLAENPDWNK